MRVKRYREKYFLQFSYCNICQIFFLLFKGEKFVFNKETVDMTVESCAFKMKNNKRGYHVRQSDENWNTGSSRKK